MASQPQLQPQPSLLSDEITPRAVVVLVVTFIVIFLSSVLVVLRFIQRRRASVKSDDWFCLASLIVAYGFTITTVLTFTIGKGGNHTYQFKNDLDKSMLFGQLFIAGDILAAASISLSKISVLLFYRRIFAIKKSLRVATWVIGFLVFGWFVSTSCGLIFPAHPIEGGWKSWIPQTHIDYKAFWVSYGSINLALDTVILCLPQPLVWRLNLSRRRKEQVSLVFLLGAFVCVASGVRIWVLAKLDMDDLPYALVPVSLWNVLEMAASIICTCLPMLPSLYRDHFGSGSKKNSKNTSERTTSLYRQPLKGTTSETGSSSSQGQLWEHDKYMDLDSTDQTSSTALRV